MNNKKILIFIFLAGILIIYAYKLYFSFFGPWKSFQGTVCDWGGCRTSPMNQKYNYWLAQAVEKKNPNICNNVEGIDGGDYMTPKEEAIYFCKADYGGKLGDVGYCNKLDNSVKFKGAATQQYVCFSKIADNTNSLSICDKLPVGSYPVSARYECYSNVAEKNRDVSICKMLPEQGYDINFRGSRKNCLISLGKALRDPSVCFNLTESWVATECVTALAVNLKSTKFCDVIPNESGRESCNRSVNR